MSAKASVRVLDSGAVVAVGLSSVLLAGLGVGGWYLWRRLEKKPAAAPTLPPVPAVPAPSAATTPAVGQQPTTPVAVAPDVNSQLKTISDQLAAQQAAAQQARTEDQVRQLIGSIAAYDNLLVRKLTEIDAVEKDNSRYQDFRTQYIDDQKRNGRWTSMVFACSDAVGRNCGGSLFGLGRCAPDNQAGCGQETVIQNGYFKGDWNGGTDENPWIIVSREAEDPTVAGSAPQRLAQWKASTRRPLEADLMVYQVQWQNLVQELKDRFGMDYKPTTSASDVYRAVALAQERQRNPNPPLNVPAASPPRAVGSGGYKTPAPAPAAQVPPSRPPGAGDRN